jgi:hypothetical protein
MNHFFKYPVLSFLLLFSAYSFAQTHAKPKPTKAFTIKYINDKLNTNSIGKCNSSMEISYRYDRTNDRPSDVILTTRTTSYYITNYSVEEKADMAYIGIAIKFQYQYLDFAESENSSNETSDVTVEIPISKIASVDFLDAPQLVNGTGTAIVTTIYGYRAVRFIMKGNFVVVNDEQKGTRVQIPLFAIPSNNLQDEQSLKTAILNLKSYYKDSEDPFK